MRSGIVCWTVPVVVLLIMLGSVQIDFVRNDHARQSATRLQIRAYMTALESFRRDVGSFPTAKEGLEALRLDPGIASWRGPYVDKHIAGDPWGHPYVYAETTSTPVIISFGADGKPGGEGFNADISSLTPIR